MHVICGSGVNICPVCPCRIRTGTDATTAVEFVPGPDVTSGVGIVRLMRVVAGEFGGRKLVSPDGTSTRPTTDRVREAMFNSLASSGVLDGALVADLFAGTGAIGIEALSRGAERQRGAGHGDRPIFRPDDVAQGHEGRAFGCRN